MASSCVAFMTAASSPSFSFSHSSMACPAPLSSFKLRPHLPTACPRFAPLAVVAETAAPASPLRTQKSKVSSKPRKQQVLLRFVWMEKNIALALEHVVPGHGTTPLSPYFFWPRKDAWEEIKTILESKKWISRKQTILLLNQATDIINLWQQNATG